MRLKRRSESSSLLTVHSPLYELVSPLRRRIVEEIDAIREGLWDDQILQNVGTTLEATKANEHVSETPAPQPVEVCIFKAMRSDVAQMTTGTYY